jgi:ubiquinone/menaquinone biosynthesis C-methylase UbiE
VQNYDKKLSDWREPVVVGAGWKPGWSSDYDAVLLAQDYGAQLIINLSNIDWVYDKDPNKYPDAKPIKKMTWEEMKKLVGDKWVPGMNAPFDPIAAQLAEKLNLTVVVANGKDFKNLEKIVSGEAFNGTVIMPYRIDASYFDKDYYSGKKGQYRIANSSFLGTGIIWLLQMYRALLIKVFLNPKTCLDVGAGTGGLVKALRTFGIDAKGIEYSKDALDMVPADIKPHILYGDINKIPFEDSSFDLVLTFDVLEHIDRSKIRKAIDETARVAKKFIYHKVYTKENTWINNFHKQDFSHISVFDKKYWTRLFTENEQLSIPRQSFFRLPSFFETVFILKKK